MSKPKSKPKRVEYVTAASYELLSDERDALEGALTDVEQERDALKADRDNLSKFAASKAGQLRELETNYHHLAVKFRQMCEYRDQWATQSAVWEEKARTFEMMWGWERETARYTIGKWIEGNIMLDVMCRAFEHANGLIQLYYEMLESRTRSINLLVNRIKLAERSIFSKLWDWFTHLGEIAERDT